MKIVALVPMKANSERVKGKNFKNFCGKPLFRWILDTLNSIKDIDSIVINTDAIDLFKKYGLDERAKIIFRERPDEIRGDLVSMNRVIENDVNNLDADIFLMTHSTNPLLSKQSIEKCINLFKDAYRKNKADSLFTVNKIQERFYDKDCKPINHDPENLLRTQDLTPWYQENSNLYIFTKESFTKSKARIGKRPIMFETPPHESLDIDTPSDWELGKVLVEYYQKKGVI